MGTARELARQIRRLDEYELRRLLILVRGLLLEVDGPPTEEPGLPAGLSYRQEHVRCGKSTCSRCPHGPYWYAYWREGGRTRKRYIGRHLPGQGLEPVEPDLGGLAEKDAAPSVPSSQQHRRERSGSAAGEEPRQRAPGYQH